MYPRAVKIVKNFQWIYSDFYTPTEYDRLVHETAVIMGDQNPTAAEVLRARQKALSITQDTEYTTLGASPRGVRLSEFEHSCLLFGGYSYGPIN